MKSIFLSILFVFALNLNAFANEGFSYVDPNLISPQFLTPPISVDSQEAEDQINDVIELQAEASKEVIKAANDERTLKPEHLTAVLGNDVTVTNYPKTFLLLKKVNADCDEVVDIAKSYWHTDRPYRSDKRIKALIKPPISYAYPSGHTACSRVMAEVLSILVPEKREILRDRAKEIANHRVLIGVHWPYDIEGGEQLSLILLGALQQSDSYRQDLDAARGEWLKDTDDESEE